MAAHQPDGRRSCRRSRRRPRRRVDLTALVSAANSTSQIFAGSSYYGTDWTKVYGYAAGCPVLWGTPGHSGRHRVRTRTTQRTANPTQPALRLPVGVQARRVPRWDPRPTVIQSDLDKSAWSSSTTTPIAPAGGFWTTYAPFRAAAADFDGSHAKQHQVCPRLDVAYEYNINSNAPSDPLNPFALGKSLGRLCLWLRCGVDSG